MQETRNPKAIPPEEAWKLVRELHVHQIELKMQSDKLRHAPQDIEVSHAQYLTQYEC